jgi:hypothetical protein
MASTSTGIITSTSTAQNSEFRVSPTNVGENIGGDVGNCSSTKNILLDNPGLPSPQFPYAVSVGYVLSFPFLGTSGIVGNFGG